MKVPIVPAVLALALLGALATEAAAQASYQQQIRTALRAAAGRLAPGAQAEGVPLTGVLNSGAADSKPVDLQAGVRYVVVGVCDENCANLDLRLFGPGSTGKVAEDAQPNATPSLTFTAPTAGRYRLAVEMASCTADPCAWGVQVLAMR